MSVFDGDDGGVPDGPKPWYVKLLEFNTAVFMFALTAFIFADVVGRYGFDHAIHGGFEIVGFMLGILIFSAFFLICRDEEHITVGLLDFLFHGRAKKIRDVGVLIASIIAVGFMSWRLLDQAERMRVDERIGEFLDIQIWPFLYAVAILSVISTLVLIVPLVKTLHRSPAKDDDANSNQMPDDSLI